MSQSPDTTALEQEIAALLRQAGSSLRERAEATTAATSPSQHAAAPIAVPATEATP